MKPYPIQLEISGPTALWTRPDTGSSPVSYVALTPRHPLRLDRGEGWVRCRILAVIGAAQGIFESVLRWKSVNVRPTRINPLRLERGEGRVRCRIRILAPVQFHRYTTNYGGPLRASDAKAIPSPPRTGRFPSPLWGEGVRRTDEVRRTNCPTTPGEVSNSSFCNVGPFRPETRACEIENHELPTLLRMVFDQMQNSLN